MIPMTVMTEGFTVDIRHSKHGAGRTNGRPLDKYVGCLRSRCLLGLKAGKSGCTCRFVSIYLFNVAVSTA